MSGDDVVLGRASELARLHALLDDLPSSGGRVVLVRGEAGIGKSTLVGAFVGDVGSRVQTHEGLCDPLGTPEPFGPVRDIARDAPSVQVALEAGDRQAVREALLDLLSHPTRPTVVVIEDVQWADEATLDTIRFLGRRITRANGLLIVTYRDDEVRDDHPVRQLFGELPPGNLVPIKLPPLSLDAIATLIGDVPLEPAQLLEFTGGNALYVAEVVAAGALTVPTSVEDGVLARVSKLSPQACGVAQAVSIHPGGMAWPVVDVLLGPVHDELRAGERGGLLRVDADGVGYRHELQRRAVESSLPTDIVRSLHRDVLAHLGDHEDPARLVHHALVGGDDDAVVRFAPPAARAAIAAGSHREAMAHFRALGPLLDRMPDPDAANVAVSWVRTAHRYGYPDDAVDVLPRAIGLSRSVANPEALARTLALGVMVLENAARPREADAAADEAIEILERLPAGPLLAEALTARARLRLLRGAADASQAVAALDRAISIADAVGDDRTAASALTLQGMLLHNARDRRGVRLMEQALDRATRGGHHFEEAEALLALAGKAADVRDLSRAIDLVERGIATAVRHELRPQEIWGRAMRAELRLWTGDWTSAEDEASELLGMQTDTDPIVARIVATIATRRGVLGAADAVHEAWTLAQGWDELTILDPAAGVVAEHLWLTDDHDADWLQQLEEVLTRGMHGGPEWPSGTLVFWMWKLGRLSDLPRSVRGPHRATIEGRPEDAAKAWDDQGATYDQAVTLLDGDDVQAVEALRIVERLGADGAARRFRHELRRRGLRVARGTSRTSRTHPAGLTARQSEVMELLADGLSNLDIADRLFLSHRTVENHVAAILRKLDVADRYAAVEVARARGLPESSDPQT